MDQKGERKEQQHPWLPPDYVSLAQLRERWLQKQQDKETREKQKEEETRKKPPEAEPSEDHKLKSGGWVEKEASGRRGAKNGGRDGARAVADRGKGKETPVGGFENRTKFRGRLSINDANLRTGDGKRENGVRLYKLEEGAEGGLSAEKKVIEKKGYSRNWRNSWGNRRNHNCRLKENGADVSKGNVVEKDSENHVRDENLEFGSERGGHSGSKVKDELVDDRGVEDEGLKSDQKAEGLVIAMDNLKVDEKRGGFGIGDDRRYGNRRWNNGRQFMSGFRSNNWNEKAGSVRRYGGFVGRFEGTERKEGEMNGMMWVRKEDRSRADDGVS